MTHAVHSMAFFILTTSVAWAQPPCDTCAWAERDGRFEGVVEKEQISGGSFELVSVQYQRPGGTSRAGDLRLSFWLPEPVELDEIKVWQPDRLYAMEPTTKSYGAGRQDFAWPRAEVVDRLGLAVDSLYTRIKAGGVYYPALLSTRAEAAVPTDYELVFRSGAGIDAMCTVARRGEVIRRFECFEEVGGTITIEWDGRDDAGRPALAGVYVLELEGDMLAETLRPLRQRYSFWHKGTAR